MSIQTELTRLTNAKAAIKTAIEGKGVTVSDGTLLDGMASLIESIEAGGGGSIEMGPFSGIIAGTVTPAQDMTKFHINASTDVAATGKDFLFVIGLSMTNTSSITSGHVRVGASCKMTQVLRNTSSNTDVYYPIVEINNQINFGKNPLQAGITYFYVLAYC